MKQTTKKVSIHNKSTHKVQISAKAGNYPNIARIRDLASQHDDLDHPEFHQLFLVSLQS